MIEIEEPIYQKMVKTTNLYLELHKKEDLTHKKIRRLQYLIKTHRTKEKVKIFGLINLYKKSKNMYLKIYCCDLLEELEGLSIDNLHIN